MPDPTGPAADRLLTSLLAVRPLAGCLTPPIRVAVATGDGDPVVVSGDRLEATRATLERAATLAGVGGLVLVADPAPTDLDVFERVISRRLALAGLPEDGLGSGLDDVAEKVLRDGFDVAFVRQTVRSPDGVPLTAYAGGAGERTVVLVPACGMPAPLVEPWLRHLARDHRVLTWESRGLFGPPWGLGDGADAGGEDVDVDTDSQAGDLLAVMDHFGAGEAHVIGLCGGAVIGLAVAASAPERIASLSLWHGAYEFSTGSLRTRFQNDLIELMTIAGVSRPAARAVQAAFCRLTLTSTPADVAHFVLYPYTDAELFFQYCRLNGSLARTDVERYLPRVEQPVLVVTSTDDQTAHPEGSRRLAARLPHASLRVEAHGDHIALFRASEELMAVAVDFIAQVTGGSVPAPVGS